MSLQWARVRQVMIICEPSIEKRVVALLDSSGAKLRTVFPVGGSGLLGAGAADLAGNLVRIECYCSATTAESIAEVLQRKFFTKYDIFITVQEASVLRPEKF